MIDIHFHEILDENLLLANMLLKCEVIINDWLLDKNKDNLIKQTKSLLAELNELKEKEIL